MYKLEFLELREKIIMVKHAKEIKIAIAAIVAIVLVFFGMNFLKGMSLFSSDNVYFLTFDDISGLSTSSPIYANGYRVGVVKGVKYDYSHPGSDIKVEADIDPNLQVPEGSTAEIVSDMLGNVRVNLLVGDGTAGIIKPGGTIPGAASQGALGQVKDMIPAIEKMLPKLDSILVSVNTLLADPAIAQSLHNIRHITNDLTTSTRELNTLMANANKQLPGLMTKADGVLTNAHQLTGKLSEVDVAGTMTKVDATLNNVQKLTTELNNNQGSLGLLMKDPTLYQNLNATLVSADSLLVNFKAHPKRYIHFSVFGKKDK